MSEAPAASLELVRSGFRRHKVRLSSEQEERFAAYLDLLQRWNDTHNLTSIRDPEEIVVRHFVEPALAKPLLAGAGPVLLDVGSGAGAPGLPLAVFDPDRTTKLVEASSKKAAFLREVVAALELPRVQVLEGRLEDLLRDGTLEAPVHVLTSRAWTSGWGTMLGLVSGVMVPGGRAIVLVGEEVYRALRRNLTSGTDLPRGKDPDWRRAAAAGWSIRRVIQLRHLDHGYAVSLELPAY